MQTLFRVCLTVSIMVFALPALAQSVKTFDGTYNGVTSTGSGGTRCLPPTPVPRPLTIQNGVAHFAGGLAGDRPFQGTVTAQGSLTMRNDMGYVVTGKIEGGKITLGGSGAGGNCVITSVWQK